MLNCAGEKQATATQGMHTFVDAACSATLAMTTASCKGMARLLDVLAHSGEWHQQSNIAAKHAPTKELHALLSSALSGFVSASEHGDMQSATTLDDGLVTKHFSIKGELDAHAKSMDGFAVAVRT